MKVKAIVTIVTDNATHASHFEGNSKSEVNRDINDHVAEMRMEGLYTDNDELIVEWPHD
jgi:hypothetical protein